VRRASPTSALGTGTCFHGNTERALCPSQVNAKGLLREVQAAAGVEAGGRRKTQID
jgi:hypothetical protein